MTQQNIELGPCRASFDGVDLGETIGPVRIEVRTIWRERHSDRYGAAPVERVAVGCQARATLRLAEKTLANLQAALPGAATGEGFLSLGGASGFRAGSAAGELRLHPLERQDAGRDVVLHKAVATGAFQVEYGPGRRAFEVEFVALLDSARQEGDRLLRMGTAD